MASTCLMRGGASDGTPEPSRALKSGPQSRSCTGMMKSGSGTVARRPGRVGKPMPALLATASVPAANVG